MILGTNSTGGPTSLFGKSRDIEGLQSPITSPSATTTLTTGESWPPSLRDVTSNKKENLPPPTWLELSANKITKEHWERRNLPYDDSESTYSRSTLEFSPKSLKETGRKENNFSSPLSDPKRRKNWQNDEASFRRFNAYPQRPLPSGGVSKKPWMTSRHDVAKPTVGKKTWGHTAKEMRKKRKKEMKPKGGMQRENVRMSSFGTSKLWQKPEPLSPQWSVNGVSPIPMSITEEIDQSPKRLTSTHWRNPNERPSPLSSNSSESKNKGFNRLPGGGWESPGPAHPPPIFHKKRSKKKSTNKKERVSRLSPRPKESLTWDDVNATEATPGKQITYDVKPANASTMKQQSEYASHAASSPDSKRSGERKRSGSPKSKPSLPIEANDLQEDMMISDCEQLDTRAADFLELQQFREKTREFRREKAKLKNQMVSLRNQLNAANDRIFELEAIQQRQSKDMEIARKDGGEAAKVKIQVQKAELLAKENEMNFLRKQIQELKIALSNTCPQDVTGGRSSQEGHASCCRKLEAANRENKKLRNDNERLKLEFSKQREQFEAELTIMRLRLSTSQNQIGTMAEPNVNDTRAKNMTLDEILQDLQSNDREYRYQFLGKSEDTLGRSPRMDSRSFAIKAKKQKYMENIGDQGKNLYSTRNKVKAEAEKVRKSPHYRGTPSESKYDPKSRTLTPSMDHLLFSHHGSPSSEAGLV